ncbi:MAG TPA: bifunctional alpha,alpha-trehalose-phosphate synthase (UDP-forming)/trehalose-phosphatase [Flavisolibacter sp.]|nr:bifunctional alpha,alpha-trehalose-phosphate synthase (UDP-forming)/trehalose-phosphatase [Flavisolibacter sp.]
MLNDKRLFIVSNRLPVNITGDDETAEIQPSSGGLVTAINSYLQNGENEFAETFWIGVPGCNKATWQKAIRQLPRSSYTYLPVFIYKEQYENYYNGFSNSVVWPLFHYFPSYVEYKPEYYDHFQRANEHFCEVLVRQLRPGDTVWIHDYHLLPLAQLLREAIPELTIGFFLHIPFPSYEVFRLLPTTWQQQLLKGILGADLIGFHTIDYASHFLQSIQMVLGLDNERNILRHDNRLIKVDVFPISIDYAHFNNAFDDQQVRHLRESLLERTTNQKIIFSVDRLDYTKGVQNRLKAYELFLQQNPDYQNKVVFVMVIVPSRDTIPKYAERKRIIDERISQVNSRMGNIHWQPVIYRYNSLPFEEMVALYTACDLALITPLRDGMNLVSKEFVSSRKDGKGVLVLSEMAGAARELTDALTINPNDIREIAQKIKTGLEMDGEEQRQRIEAMQSRIKNYDVQIWADDFMTELRNIKEKQNSFQVKFIDHMSKRELFDAYRSGTKRLLLLDYDGTLVPFAANPDNAIPGKALLDLISGLSAGEGNDVYVISGRNSSWLDKHFGAMPVNLVSEHGARFKWKNSEWVTQVNTHSEWKQQVYHIMEMYVRRCANSFIEEKDFSIVWHYRNANPDQGKLRASELSIELNEYTRPRQLEVLAGNKIIEVRNSGTDKGTAIKKILDRGDYDFIFAVGDDRTDEDMFRQLADMKNSFTIKVGSEASYAHYNLHTPQMVVSLLEGLHHLSPIPIIQ